MKSIIAILAVSCALLFAAHAGERPEYSIYITAKADSGIPLNKPADKFACRDKIYGVVEINRPDGDNAQHTLYATWRNPSGDDQEVTEYPFNLINGSARVWVWLKLHRSAESSLTQFLNPSGGLEEFAGEWRLEVRIDDQPVGKTTFQMLC